MIYYLCNIKITAYNKSFSSALKETILDLMGVHFTILPSLFSISPGLISI